MSHVLVGREVEVSLVSVSTLPTDVWCYQFMEETDDAECIGLTIYYQGENRNFDLSDEYKRYYMILPTILD